MSLEACKHFEQIVEGVDLAYLETTYDCFKELKTGDTWGNLAVRQLDEMMLCR